MNYIKIYYQIISKAAGREYSILYDRHHIIPRGLGGPDNVTNLIYLTPKEHMLAHHLLAKAYPTVPEIQSGFNVPSFKYYNVICYVDRIKNLMMNLVNSKHRNTNVQQLGELYNALKNVDMDKIVFKKSKPIEKLPKTPMVVDHVDVSIDGLGEYLTTPIPSQEVTMSPSIARIFDNMYVPVNPDPDPTVEIVNPPKKKRPTLKRIKAPDAVQKSTHKTTKPTRKRKPKGQKS